MLRCHQTTLSDWCFRKKKKIVSYFPQPYGFKYHLLVLTWAGISPWGKQDPILWRIFSSWNLSPDSMCHKMLCSLGLWSTSEWLRTDLTCCTCCLLKVHKLRITRRGKTPFGVDISSKELIFLDDFNHWEPPTRKIICILFCILTQLPSYCMCEWHWHSERVTW